MKKVDLTIGGMTCDRCASHVTEALEQVSGVAAARVPGWRSGQAEVQLGADVDAAELVGAVEAAGYRASVQKEEVSGEGEGARKEPEGGGAEGYGGPLDTRGDGAPVVEAPAVAVGPEGDAYDLVVVGGGSAAFAAAIKVSELGGRAAIVNAGPEAGALPVGGTCVNVGCVPSKATIRAAEAVHRARRQAFHGVETSADVADFGAVMRQVQALVADLRDEKYVGVVEGDPNVTLVEGRARLSGAHTVEVAGGPTLRAKRVLIATGARTFVPEVPGLEEAGYLTNEELYRLQERPEHLVVLGGRYVALENAQAFARLGARVTVLQRSTRVLPDEAADLTDALTGFLRADGVDVRTGVTARAVRREGDEVVVEVTVDGRDGAVRGSHLLLATGRRGNTEGLGLGALGVGTDRRGFLRVDGTLRTAVPTVFGAGDVLGDKMFVYTAAYEGALAARNALQGLHAERDYAALPWVVFTDPQVAGVGIDERQAAEAGVDADVATLPLSAVPRALAARDTRGFVRLVRDRATDRLVGARVLAPEGAELLMEVVLAIKHGVTAQELSETFHPYLTLSEAVKLAALTFRKDVGKLSCCAA